jgi:SAM-dependent methyltransferase
MSAHEHCCAVATMFDEKVASRDLRNYRRRGAGGPTRRLLAAIREAGVQRATLLDIGGGVGAVAHELLADDVTRATIIEPSASYLEAARQESKRRGTTDRLRLRQGDVVAMAAELEIADVVTLDKVVCCYPDMDMLLAVSAACARRLYGIVYPRDRWWVRLFIAVENGVRRVRGNAFQGFVHRNAAIDAALRSAGLVLRAQIPGVWWVVAVYERRADGV